MNKLSMSRELIKKTFAGKTLLFLGCLFVIGCTKFSSLNLSGAPREVPPELKQNVGLLVHSKPERSYYFGSALLDASDLMGFHLQQTLPFNVQSALQEIFTKVEVSDSENKIQFKTPNLAGYFEVTMVSVRYDYPDPGLSSYRADVELLVEFKTLDHRVVWNALYRGDGVGYSNADLRQNRFSNETSAALDDAFQRAVEEMRDGILKAVPLRDYFRSHPQA